MKKLLAIVTFIYASSCAAMMFMMPMNEYEWMLGDPKARADGLTFCWLPLDDGIDARGLTFVAMLPLFFMGGVLSVRTRRIHYAAWLALTVLALWGWRFFIHYPLCSGREAS